MKGERATIFKDKVITEGEWNCEANTTAIWNQLANCIRKVAKEVLGESKGKIHYNKKTLWWSVEVQEVVREKRRYKV